MQIQRKPAGHRPVRIAGFFSRTSTENIQRRCGSSRIDKLNGSLCLVRFSVGFADAGDIAYRIGENFGCERGRREMRIELSVELVSRNTLTAALESCAVCDDSQRVTNVVSVLDKIGCQLIEQFGVCGRVRVAKIVQQARQVRVPSSLSRAGSQSPWRSRDYFYRAASRRIPAWGRFSAKVHRVLEFLEWQAIRFWGGSHRHEF